MKSMCLPCHSPPFEKYRQFAFAPITFIQSATALLLQAYHPLPHNNGGCYLVSVNRFQIDLYRHNFASFPTPYCLHPCIGNSTSCMRRSNFGVHLKHAFKPQMLHQLLDADTEVFLLMNSRTGYLAHLFGKSHHKSDRAYLHWLQKDVQLGSVRTENTGVHQDSIECLLLLNL